MESSPRCIWKDKPSLVPFLIGTSAGIFVVMLPFIVVGGVLIASVGISNIIEGFTRATHPWLYVAIPVGFIFLFAVLRLWIWSVTAYEVFEDKIILTSGLIGRDLKIIPMLKIQNLSVDVGLIGKLTGTGNLRFFSGEMESSGHGTGSKYDVFEAVPDPYQLAQTIESLRTPKSRA